MQIQLALISVYAFLSLSMWGSIAKTYRLNRRIEPRAFEIHSEKIPWRALAEDGSEARYIYKYEYITNKYCIF